MYINNFFILASSSKSRRLILKNLNLNFKIIKPKNNEEVYKKKIRYLKTTPEKFSLELSKYKAKEVSNKIKNKMVVAADTIIILNGNIIEKAKSLKEAKKNIKKMSGKNHMIISSAVAYYNKRLIWSKNEKTRVKIRKLKTKEINNYLKLCGKEILSSVGCYQIEKTGPNIIETIKGDFFNVMGFPLFPFLKFLIKTDCKLHEN